MAAPEFSDPSRTSSIRPSRLSGLVLTLACVLFGYWLFNGIRDAREAARRSNCKGELKQIQLALFNYCETYGCFPPPYFADSAGRPMHSWRVLILPFIDHEQLYKAYRFDEPWDGPNNRQLSDKIVLNDDYSFYHCPSDRPATGKLDATMTSYVAVIGPETAWKGDDCVSLRGIGDAPDKTLLVVEVANSGINWMEPRDLHVGQMAPTINPKAGQGISSRHPGGAHAATVDGGVRFLFDKTPASALRALLTISGGEQIGWDDL